MVSDWPKADPSTWNRAQRVIDHLKLYPIYPDQPPPQFAPTDKIPFMPAWSQHRYILVFAAVPLLLHQAWVSLTGWPVSKVAAIIFYYTAYKLIAVREVRLLRGLIYEHGVLDGAVARDGIPNTGTWKIIGELEKTTGFRMVLAVLLTYDPKVSPLDALSDTSTWTPFFLKLCLYGVTLDFFFYTYHRACHEIPGLWKYHRTHHLAKHPTAVHSGFADDEQEILEILIVPFLTYMTLRAVGLPLGFYEWWICFEYLTWAEVWGHCGLRVHGIVPSPISAVLGLLDMELALEDHDLHHRKGWKKSFNYGKQTRVWDRLFGSCTSRLEASKDNVDYGKLVPMPLS
ncbi:Fatty acid hydroxylase [Cordyceps fumosorosea ARSEF 2679]|uniref:Fatty acid hydroxylase n=1 Tax=Cordyceps fumosorosea (strain ARSEF 2679) TaxID=1081104 RepID=A0A167DYF4_CORFA|nr:Fatty acid hydroxylase [Cordyceps fumosorosea ARSEF 2679]OAA43050.1 Fatty acid hydroxylase [Cordyceps fumosorosea ARSEF 2679]